MAYTINLKEDLIAGHLVSEMIIRLSEQGYCAEWLIKERTIVIRAVRKVSVLIGNKRVARHLTLDEWTVVNNLVQDVLDRESVDADVWSTPAHVKGRLWLRKGTCRRVQWHGDKPS